MKALNHTIALYIHPDSGPIKPMALNVTAVEEAIYRAPGSANRDDIAVEEIANQICKQFPGVNPRSNRRLLAALMGRLSHADTFNGIVLRLRGTIVADQGTAAPTSAVQRELEGLTADVARLQSELNQARQQCQELKAHSYGKENEVRRFKTLYERANNELGQLRLRIDELRLEREQTRVTAKQLRDQADQSMQQVARLNTQLAMKNRELQERPTKAYYEQQISSIRLKHNSAERKIKDQQAAIEQLEQEKEDLFQRLQTLVMGPPPSEVRGGDEYGEL